ncbi:hypothetical protein OSB04_024835 [Centaurea solstitialis]|uniref:Reverse transcriptase Ty1/copia-type domain-containing protein n=1 Tax=Centaurea solstitialis TaxID=347529 RepID=A0AA38SMI6_9ASTR|nr:hypothetical protein OSB04_024835 [Centaurea solstitialis]
MWSTFGMYWRLYARSGCVGRREDTSDRDIENRVMQGTGVDFTGEGRGHGSLLCLVPIWFKGIVSFSLEEKAGSVPFLERRAVMCADVLCCGIRRISVGNNVMMRRVLGCDLDWATPKQTDTYLSLGEFWYNGRFHASIGMPLYEMLCMGEMNGSHLLERGWSESQGTRVSFWKVKGMRWRVIKGGNSQLSFSFPGKRTRREGRVRADPWRNWEQVKQDQRYIPEGKRESYRMRLRNGSSVRTFWDEVLSLLGSNLQTPTNFSTCHLLGECPLICHAKLRVQYQLYHSFLTDSSLSLDTPFTTPIPTPVPDSPATISDPSPPVPSPSPTSETPVESTDPGTTSSEIVRRSNRVRQVPAHIRDHHCYATLLSNHEPISYKEAASSSHWQAAMQEELRALTKAQTWDPIKTKSDGSIDRYKARLVAKGFNQEYGIDYEENFAHVARVTSVLRLLAIAATKHWPLFQMDVKNAFLNGDLSEEVYMTPPPGVSLPSGYVCRLRKALYGLKQAHRAWFEKFSNTVLSLGFSASNYDSGLFTRTTDSRNILLLLYIDDMIITGDDSIGIASPKQSISSSFEMKDLDRLHYFLGLEVLSDSSDTYLCQAKYISDLFPRLVFPITRWHPLSWSTIFIWHLILVLSYRIQHGTVNCLARLSISQLLDQTLPMLFIS